MLDSTCDIENMRLWVAALRSGEFAQGRKRLAQSGDGGATWRYCCLGVACELAIRHGVEVKTTTMGARLPSAGTDLLVEVKGYDGDFTLLPASVQRWLGLPLESVITLPFPDDADYDIPASQANDALGWSFDRIADALVSYYKLDEDDGDNGPGTD